MENTEKYVNETIQICLKEHHEGRMSLETYNSIYSNLAYIRWKIRQTNMLIKPVNKK